MLPYADMGQKFKAGLLEGRFTGDPSFEYEHSVSHKVGEDESEQIVSVGFIDIWPTDRVPVGVVSCSD